VFKSIALRGMSSLSGGGGNKFGPLSLGFSNNACSN